MVALNSRIWHYINDVMLVIYVNIFIIYGMGEIMANFTYQDINDGLKRISDATTEVDSVMKQANLSPVGDFMTNMALKETYAGAGYDKDATHTIGPWQIDPIRMYDIQQNIINSRQGTGGMGTAYKERADIINKHMANLGYQDFDIANIATVNKDGDSYSYGNIGEHANDPLVNAFLTRLALTSVPEAVPDNMYGQADYWKDHWNKSGAGKPIEFTKMLSEYRPHYYSTREHQDKLMYGPMMVNKAFKYE